MAATPNPPAARPPVDRFCDLVMKGGITSGVVYPRAIGRLARHYHFKSIGGTSAGAIAAAVTAAAEYQRRQTGSNAGFDLLGTLPDLLKEQVSPGRSKLLSLFQPQRATGRLFGVLITALNSGGTWRRVARIVWGFMKAYWLATLTAFVLAGVVYTLGQGWLATALTLLLALPLAIGLWVYRDLTRNVVANGFGLCSGLTEDPRHPALTPWLHDLIQRAAGRTADDDPLTFGDLWGAKGFPPPWLKVADPTQVRSIDLQMFSTNLSHGRPYVFPLPEADGAPTRFRSRERLFFKRDEIARLMPPKVVDWMWRHAQPYTLEPGREGKEPPTEQGADLRELPPPRELPVLLAARMSLSFPLLFSAVPLHAIDYDPPSQRGFRPCWFSDGGISSNFPMHLFDGLVPMWPTFGISLEPKIEGRPDVFLPAQYGQGYGERWSRFGEKAASASRLGGFFSAIVATMQNWNDNSLARMPGVRDRVARLRLDAKEGGLNLNMEAELIAGIAERGERAAEELIGRFVAAADGKEAAGWDEHRFVRLSILLKMIQARTPGVARALSPDCAHATELSSLLAAYLAARDPQGQPVPPPGYETPLTPALITAIDAAVKTLVDLAERLQPVGPAPFKPVPAPELRVRPPL